MKRLLIIANSALILAACSGQGEEPETVEEVDATEVEAELPETSETAFEVCDENGNRYASEEAAKEAGLEEAQYGATYCQYFE
ncbi:hypothetical protein BPTFM16_01459 [Altererythrobacter insulae]|nr:hypothetical protein BPTFM16_01459 [Altererythrobacter insulae]